MCLKPLTSCCSILQDLLAVVSLCMRCVSVSLIYLLYLYINNMQLILAGMQEYMYFPLFNQ